MTDPPGSLQSFRYQGGSDEQDAIAVAGLLGFLSGTPDTWAFTTQPVTPDTMSKRLSARTNPRTRRRTGNRAELLSGYPAVT
jgi:hypothetical protein